jgi:hypothetical protein
MTATCSFSARQVVLNSVQYTQFIMGVSGAICDSQYHLVWAEPKTIATNDILYLQQLFV